MFLFIILASVNIILSTFLGVFISVVIQTHSVLYLSDADKQLWLSLMIGLVRDSKQLCEV